MRIWVRFCLLIVLIGIVKTACGSAYEHEFNYHFIKTAIVPYENITIVRTMDELEVFKNSSFSWSSTRNLSLMMGNAEDLSFLLSYYDYDYFDSSYLVIISSIDSSGGIINSVQNVFSDGAILIHKISNWDGGATLALVHFTILLELSNDVEIDDFSLQFKLVDSKAN